MDSRSRPQVLQMMNAEMTRLASGSSQFQAVKAITAARNIIYTDPAQVSEEVFEHALWERLQSLANKDAWLGQPYDERVSRDPDDPHFSLSFGGEAFFAIGLHAAASRPAVAAPRQQFRDKQRQTLGVAVELVGCRLVEAAA